MDTLPQELHQHVWCFLPVLERLRVISRVSTGAHASITASLTELNISFAGSAHAVGVLDRQFSVHGLVQPAEYAELAATPLHARAFTAMQSHEGHLAWCGVRLPPGGLAAELAVAAGLAQKATQKARADAVEKQQATGALTGPAAGTPATSGLQYRVYAVASRAEADALTSRLLVAHQQRRPSHSHDRGLPPQEQTPRGAADGAASFLSASHAQATSLMPLLPPVCPRVLFTELLARLCAAAGAALTCLRAADTYLDAGALLALAPSCPRLRELDMGAALCHRVHSRHGSLPAVLAAHFQCLERLDFSGGDVQPADVAAVLAGLPRLATLAAHGCAAGHDWRWPLSGRHAALTRQPAGAAEAKSQPSDEEDGSPALRSPPRPPMLPSPPCAWLFRVPPTAGGLAALALCELRMTNTGAGQVHALMAAAASCCASLRVLDLGYDCSSVAALGPTQWWEVYPLQVVVTGRSTSAGDGGDGDGVLAADDGAPVNGAAAHPLRARISALPFQPQPRRHGRCARLDLQPRFTMDTASARSSPAAADAIATCPGLCTVLERLYGGLPLQGAAVAPGGCFDARELFWSHVTALGLPAAAAAILCPYAAALPGVATVLGQLFQPVTLRGAVVSCIWAGEDCPDEPEGGGEDNGCGGDATAAPARQLAAVQDGACANVISLFSRHAPSPASMLWQDAWAALLAAPCAGRLTELSLRGHVPVGNTVLARLATTCGRLARLQLSCLQPGAAGDDGGDGYVTADSFYGAVAHDAHPPTDCFDGRTAALVAAVLLARRHPDERQAGVGSLGPGVEYPERATSSGVAAEAPRASDVPAGFAVADDGCSYDLAANTAGCGTAGGGRGDGARAELRVFLAPARPWSV
jgi:hypothetical protein